MGVPNFRIFSPLRMRADLNNFWWTWEPTRRTFGKFRAFFFWQKKIPNSQPKFLFVNSEIFFCQKKKARNFPKVRHVGSRVHQKLFKSARILSGEKIFGFLLGSACSGLKKPSFFGTDVWCDAHELATGVLRAYWSEAGSEAPSPTWMDRERAYTWPTLTLPFAVRGLVNIFDFAQ